MLTSVIVYIVIIVDQLTKWWADRKLQYIVNADGEVGKIDLIEGVLSFDHALNPGMAWGMLKDHRWVFLLLTSVIIFAILAFLIYTKNTKKHPFFITSLGLILGGGISNMIDRVFFGEVLFGGSVIDFISFELIDFPIFNVADSCVCIGEVLLIIYVLFIDPRIRNKDLFTFSEKNKNAENGNTEEK